MNGSSRTTLVTIHEAQFKVSSSMSGDRLELSIGDSSSETLVRSLGPHHWMIRIENRWLEAYADVRNGEGHLVVGGRQYTVSLVDERAQRLAAITNAVAGGSQRVDVRAPMPGLVVSVPIAVGQIVKRGDRLVVLQAMKMENELTSPQAGRVSAIHAEESQTVEQGFVLVSLEGEHS